MKIKTVIQCSENGIVKSTVYRDDVLYWTGLCREDEFERLHKLRLATIAQGGTFEPKFRFKKQDGQWECRFDTSTIVGYGNSAEEAAGDYQLELEIVTSDIHQ